jgi:uncharacterized protein (TIGR00725 family)
MRKIAIIGPNKSVCSNELYDFGVELGKGIVEKERVFICGGQGGFMEAVCKGIKGSSKSYNGQTIGILPEDNDSNANPYIDIALPTGLGIARNILIINSADIIISAGGGAGTLSELAFAWQKKKKVLCITQFGGWSNELANKDLDKRTTNLLIEVNSIQQIKKYLDNV